MNTQKWRRGRIHISCYEWENICGVEEAGYECEEKGKVEPKMQRKAVLEITICLWLWPLAASTFLQRTVLFYGCVVYHGVYVPYFLYPVTIPGKPGWFYVFAIVTSTAMNKRVHVCVCVCVCFSKNPFSFGYILSDGIWGQMVFLVLDPWGLPHCLPQWLN